MSSTAGEQLRADEQLTGSPTRGQEYANLRRALHKLTIAKWWTELRCVNLSSICPMMPHVLFELCFCCARIRCRVAYDSDVLIAFMVTWWWAAPLILLGPFWTKHIKGRLRNYINESVSLQLHADQHLALVNDVVKDWVCGAKRFLAFLFNDYLFIN